LELATIFKTLLSLLFVGLFLSSFGQETKDTLTFYEIRQLDSITTNDSLFLVKDTIFYEKFIGYNYKTFAASKSKIRKSLISQKNPPNRKNINNHIVFLWLIFTLLIIILFKSSYPFQYKLIIRSFYNTLFFREFIETQTKEFKISKLLTWFITAQMIGIGVFVFLKNYDKTPAVADFLLIVYINLALLTIFILSQLLKNIFSFAFNQKKLETHYAIIFRINAFFIGVIFLPIIVISYYNSSIWLADNIPTILVVFMILIYASSILKFVLSRDFYKSDSILILILYICSFEILPIMVLLKSLNKFLII